MTEFPYFSWQYSYFKGLIGIYIQDIIGHPSPYQRHIGDDAHGTRHDEPLEGLMEPIPTKPSQENRPRPWFYRVLASQVVRKLPGQEPSKCWKP